MSLDKILAFRQPEANAATIQSSIAEAEAMKADLARRIAELEDQRVTQLLTASDKELAALEKEADQARRNVARLDSLLPHLVEDLKARQGADTVLALRAKAETTQQALDALRAWQEGPFETIREQIAEGLQLEHEALAACQEFEGATTAAYQRLEVREAGPLGVAPPQLPEQFPSMAFPNWSMPA
jgi:predicted  nucleic acid-binding Zn-ribbon protein